MRWLLKKRTNGSVRYCQYTSLMTATFGNYAYLRAEKLGQLDNFFTHICQLVALITIGLLFIGVLNAPINAYEMVIYPIAFFVCLFGQMRLFRSV
ncbi:hypothetical protein [Shigella sonnei]|uniref:hypothetical protein n=1 Tax=Shigella sonnei TaxID=624 RepID=UPI00097CF6E0|nr:hypothetical protein [Shigella sonnei]